MEVHDVYRDVSGPGLINIGQPLTCGTCLSTFDGTPCTTTCSYGSACVGGTCVASAGNAGDPCNGVGLPDGCSAPFHCDSTQHCIAPSPFGTACKFTGDCDKDLVCDSANTKTCVTPPAENASCVSVPCANGLGCNGILHTCLKPVFVDQGQPCGDPTVMCKRGTCAVLPNNADQCPMIISVAQPCNAADPTQSCEEMASCVTGMCQLFDPRRCM